MNDLWDDMTIVLFGLSIGTYPYADAYDLANWLALEVYNDRHLDITLY